MERPSEVFLMRGSVFSKDVVMRYYEAIRYGASYKHAAEYAGISTRTAQLWRTKGANGEEPFATFVQGIMRARGEFVTRNLQAIHAHSAIDWKAAAWLLERTHPEEYAQRQYIEEEPALLKELKELINAGSITADQIKQDIPTLPDEYYTALLALEASIGASDLAPPPLSSGEYSEMVPDQFKEQDDSVVPGVVRRTIDHEEKG